MSIQFRSSDVCCGDAHRHVRRHGLTLLELLIVLTILAALGGVALRLSATARDDARLVATRTSLNTIRDAVTEYWRDTKWITLDGVNTTAVEANRFQIRWLSNSPIDGSVNRSVDFANTRIGWNGPYVMPTGATYVIASSDGFTNAYGSNGDPAVFDGFADPTASLYISGRPIVVQDVDPNAELRDVRIVSAGPNGVLETPPSVATAALTDADVGDDIYVAITLR